MNVHLVARRPRNIFAPVMVLAFACSGLATVYHVAKTGNDSNNGAVGTPFLTISKGAAVANAGDSIIVHAGTYREWVKPPRGGSSESTRITYTAAPGEIVDIKGSEQITSWVSQGNGVWKADVPDAFFGANNNPFTYNLYGRFPDSYGNQYLYQGKWCHLGEVYLDNQIYLERQTLAEVQSNQKTWYVSHSGTMTSIYANFGANNPNTQLAEINTRQCVFSNYSNDNLSYITVNGFRISQSAEDWIAPCCYQGISPSLINTSGTHWIIQNCRIRFAKMRGVCTSSSTIKVNKHIIRDNIISHCGIAGIAGTRQYGNFYSGNWICDIGSRPYGGDEEGFIKQNETGNLTISGNVMYNMISTSSFARGIMLDWPHEGWHITGNLMMNSTNHLIYIVQQIVGNVLVDNNVFVGNNPSGTNSEVYVNNLYIPNGFGAGARNVNNMTLSSSGYVIDTVARTVTLKLNISSALANQNNPIASTSSLGMVNGAPVVSNQDSTPISINYDMLFNCRGATAKSGPFQNIVSGMNTIVIRPNNNFLNGILHRVPCSEADTNVVSIPSISPGGGFLFSPIQVAITCATSGAQIYYTLDGSAPTQSSILYSAAFTLSSPATIKARGFKSGKTQSEVGSTDFVAPRLPENPANAVAGLNYSYYEGSWSSLPNFNSLSSIKTGTVNGFDLSIRNRDDNFGVVYAGFVAVPQDGMYTFTTSSDDGSALYIGTTEVVNNDGTHGAQNASGVIGLKAGKHLISVVYFEGGGEQVLTASWQGPGVTTGQIPAGALFHVSGSTVLWPVTVRAIGRKSDFKEELFEIDGKRAILYTASALRMPDRSGVRIVRVKNGSGALSVRKIVVVW